MKKFLLPLLWTALLSPARIFAQDIDISTAGWRLWPDRGASWKNDDLYLPAEVDLEKMPVNAPTDGWKSLNDRQGIPVTLPSTVEEHYWGRFGTRPYTKNEAQRGAGTSFPNGSYQGVSWWWRTIRIPDFRPGQRIVVSFRGARFRAEVYCNQRLCGYSIMEELPFTADITGAVKPGQPAQLTIRITNPGGHFDWIDFAQMQIRWGKYTLPPSHGFGGLDNDILLSVRDRVSVTDLAAINTPDLHKVHLVAEIAAGSEPFEGVVHFSITGQTVSSLWQADRPLRLSAGERQTIAIDADVPAARPWNLNTPVLYQATAMVKGLAYSGRKVRFGFRYFTAEGIGSDARLTLNGKRIVPVSAISWGYWGRNGLWPDAAMAEREVAVAKKMGLTALQFHRNIGKPAVLDVQDREGLLRCEEPGGGKFALGARYARGPFGPGDEFLAKDEGLLQAFEPVKGYTLPDSVDESGNGPDGDARAFWEKFEEEKILEMVRRDRSHPSLIMYTVQNEGNETDLRNPRIYRLFRSIHALDPSRLLVLYSGGVPKNDQVMMLPYSDEIHRASKAHPFAGWQDVHTCGGPCNYLDFLYKDPTHFRQRQDPASAGNISEWGEMLGAAGPDNYEQLVHSFDRRHPTGYELDDAEKVLAGYHRFLDRWNFRTAFPTDSSLFRAIGYRNYYFWKRILEQSRMDNTNDYLVISGWESTAIDNHSGLVDNHRFPKGDPSLIAEACKPEVLVIQPRHMIVAQGDRDTVDIFLINTTGRKGPYTLNLTVKNPDGSVAYSAKREVHAEGGDTYGQLLSAGISFPAGVAGMTKALADITPLIPGPASLDNSDEINVIGLDHLPLLKNIAVLEPGDQVKGTLRQVFHLDPLRLDNVPATTHLDAIVIAAMTTDHHSPAGKGSAGDHQEARKPQAAVAGVGDSLLDRALDRVKNDGTRLVLWPDDEHLADAMARALAARHILKDEGMAGNLNAPWFGSWFFVRRHWLLDGLPVNCAMDWRYGVSAFGGPEWLKEEPRGTSTNGLLLDAPGMEVAVGFGADHNTHVGISGCTIPYGKGMIVLYCLPQLVRSLDPGDFAISRVVCQRLLGNALSIRR